MEIVNLYVFLLHIFLVTFVHIITYYVNYIRHWEKHINTELHKTGKRKKRTDYKEPTKCDFCDYVTTKNTITLKKHMLNKHKSKEERKKEFKFYCEECNVGSFSKDTMNLYYNSEKHKHYSKNA